MSTKTKGKEFNGRVYKNIFLENEEVIREILLLRDPKIVYEKLTKRKLRGQFVGFRGRIAYQRDFIEKKEFEWFEESARLFGCRKSELYKYVRARMSMHKKGIVVGFDGLKQFIQGRVTTVPDVEHEIIELAVMLEKSGVLKGNHSAELSRIFSVPPKCWSHVVVAMAKTFPNDLRAWKDFYLHAGVERVVPLTQEKCIAILMKQHSSCVSKIKKFLNNPFQQEG